MLSLTVRLHVKPGHLEDFLAAISSNARHSFNDEPGCLYFDVSQDIDDELHFTFFEIYQDADALEDHRHAPHFKQWRKAVAEHVVAGSQHNIVARRLFHYQ